MPRRRPVRAVWFAAVATGAFLLGPHSAGVRAQHGPGDGPDDGRWREDPYTEGREDQLQRLGYVAMGRMAWAEGFDTDQILESLGNVRIRWIETEHFKLGCELAALPMPRHKDVRAPLREELRRLARRLPRLKPRSVRTLDPWLRAHLYAQRLEDLYARILELGGHEQDDFPAADDAPAWPSDLEAGQTWMGRGPHLGVRGKFLVMLCQKESTCARFLATYANAPVKTPYRWYYTGSDAFLFATAVEFNESVYAAEEDLHAHVVFNVANNLLDAYRGYSYQVPAWWKEGLCHVLRREVHDEFNDYTAFDGDRTRAYTVFEWAEKVGQRLEYDLVKPLPELLDVTDPAEFTLVDHWACWSRMSWILQELPPARFAAFLDGIKAMYDDQGMPPDEDDVARLQPELIERAFGASAAELDAAWKDWARREARRKR